MNKEVMAIETNTVIALCYIRNDFDDFKENLTNFIKNNDCSKKDVKLIQKLGELSHGKNIINKRVRKFYKENKKVIDKINEYTNIRSFIANYLNPKYNEQINYIHRYIRINNAKINLILKNLDNLNKLGFKSFKFNEALDFTKETYKIDTFFMNNSNVVYTDNIEAVPSYETNQIKYKTNKSNFKIILKTSLDRKLNVYSISLNSLLFDYNRIPKIMNKETIFDKLVNLPKEQIEIFNSIKNSVNMNVGIFDLKKELEEFYNKVEKMTELDNKQELIKLLKEIKEKIKLIESIATDYDNEIIENNEYITENLLENEKNSYIKKRENLVVHIW
ncbi:MAG: hypothetical protein IJO57_05120 [Bacilli bacterium]|nr:hypothetical protein [Bacilli bacterium]